MLAHRNVAREQPLPLVETLERTSCAPVLTLPQQTVAVSDAAFVFPSPPWSSSAPAAGGATAPSEGLPQRGVSAREDVRYLLTVDRDDTIKLWDVALRRAVHEMSFARLLAAYDAATARASGDTGEGDPRSLAEGDEGHQLRRRPRVKGLLAVTDVSSTLLSEEQRRTAPGGILPRMFAFLVQGRNQIVALVVLEAVASNSKGSGFTASIQVALDVPQFGFCKAIVVPVPSSCSSHAKRRTVFVCLPGEAAQAPGCGGGGGFVLLYAIRQQGTAGGGSTPGCAPAGFDHVLIRRVQVADKSLRCGQLMSMQMFPWMLRDATTNCTELKLLSLVTTESGHAVIAAHTIALHKATPASDDDDDAPTMERLSASESGGGGCAMLRCCAEPLMDAHLGLVVVAAAGGTTSKERMQLFCVSAEGNIQAFLVDDESIASMWASNVGAVVPQWPLLWEHKTQKGAGVVGLVSCGSRRPAGGIGDGAAAKTTFVVVGGWDGSILLLDGIGGTIATCLDYHTKSITGLYFVAQPCSSDGIGRTMAAPCVCPAFARAVRSSRLGQPRNASGAQHQRRSSPVVFCSTADDGTIAFWRFDF